MWKVLVVKGFEGLKILYLASLDEIGLRPSLK